MPTWTCRPQTSWRFATSAQLLEHLQVARLVRRSAAPPAARTDASLPRRRRDPPAPRLRDDGAAAGRARRVPRRRTRRPACWSRPGRRRAPSSALPGRAAARRPGASSSVSGSRSINSSSTPSVSVTAEPTFHALRARGARPPPRRSTRRSARSRARRNDARVAADLHRALRVPEEVRVVPFLPHEHEVGRGHEDRDERARRSRARERIGADAEPARVVVVGVVDPEQLVFLEQLVLDRQRPALVALGLPRRKVSPMGVSPSGCRTHNEVYERPRRRDRALGRRHERRPARARLPETVARKLAVAADRLDLRHVGGSARRDDGGARPARRAGGVRARPPAPRHLLSAAAVAAAAERAARVRPARHDRASDCSIRSTSHARSQPRRSR